MEASRESLSLLTSILLIPDLACSFRTPLALLWHYGTTPCVWFLLKGQLTRLYVLPYPVYCVRSLGIPTPCTVILGSVESTPLALTHCDSWDSRVHSPGTHTHGELSSRVSCLKLHSSLSFPPTVCYPTGPGWLINDTALVQLPQHRLTCQLPVLRLETKSCTRLKFQPIFSSKAALYSHPCSPLSLPLPLTVHFPAGPGWPRPQMPSAHPSSQA